MAEPVAVADPPDAGASPQAMPDAPARAEADDPLVTTVAVELDAGAGTQRSATGAEGMDAAADSGEMIAHRAGTGGAADTSAAGVGGAAGAAGAAGSAGQAAAGGGASGAGGAGDLAPATDASAELFDPERLPRFDIALSSDARAALDSAPDTYVRATLQYGSITLSDVGVRIKGEASLRTLAQKPALKLKLDEFVSGQNLFGLKRITLNNLVSDPSFIAERLAYHMYRAAKLPAPRCNSALVYINDDFYGVYANVESEDKAFLRRWFASDEGNLYEDAQVDLKPGNEALFDLETNETLNDRSDLRALIAALDGASADALLSDLAAKLDTEHFLRFTALEAAVDQWDMYGYTVFEPNNFRLYNDPTVNKFTFLPWGMDMALKPLPFTQRPHIRAFEVPLYEDQPGARAAGGLIFARCLASTSCKTRYAQVLREVIALWDAEKLDQLAARYYAQIKDSVYSDSRKELTNQAFDAGYQSLLTTIQTRSSALHADLDQAGL